MSSPKSQVSDSSTSLLSEPPDIKKWFSSYTYQSPVLDTNEDFCFPDGVDNEKKGLYVQENENEEEGKCEDLTKIKQSIICKSTEKVEKHGFSSPFSVEVPAYPDSLSLPSEPPDITNWFPSYVYDSPELDSSEFDFSLSKEDHHLRELPLTKVENKTPCCLEEITRHVRVQDNENPSTVHEDHSERSELSPKNILFPETTFNQKTTKAESNTCNVIPDKSDVCATVTAQNLLSIVQDDNINLIRSPAKKLRAVENDSCWISLNHKQRKEDCRSTKEDCRSTKEEQRKLSTENQFISVKNKASPMINKENYPGKSVCSFDEQKSGMLRREVLKETTNFDCSHVPEIAGKWRCPQKTKPYSGPPLKQLRLERWVHKK